jgi:hypothetical protein
MPGPVTRIRRIRPQAHTAASLLVWNARRDAVPGAVTCLVCGHLPDFDRTVAKRLGVRRRDHHRWVSHSLAGWLPPSVVALACARGTRHAGLVRRGVLAVWVHLLLDTYADGIAWLWPLDEEKIGFFRRSPEIIDRGWHTPAPLGTELGKAEAAMWIAAAARLHRLKSRP